MGLEVNAFVLFLLLTHALGVNAAGDEFEGFEDAECQSGDVPSFINKQVSVHSRSSLNEIIMSFL